MSILFIIQLSMDSLGYSPAVEVSDEGEAVPVVERAAGKWEVAEPVVMEAVRPQSAQGLRSPLFPRPP